jgi:hypothetical protein
VLKYAAAPGILPEPTIACGNDKAHLANTIYGEAQGCDTGVAQRFTAIGRPMPVSSPDVRVNLGLHSAPQHLPVRFRDDSIIPVVLQLPGPSGIQ